MIRPSAIAATAVVGPALVAPMLFLTPPLSTDPELAGRRPAYAVERELSTPALAGKHVFADTCSSCHGTRGEGTRAGPAISLSARSFDNRAFHNAIRQGADAHAEMGRRQAALSFNEIERMAKYLRELQRIDQI